MNANCFGVAKWSTPGSVTRRGVGQRLDQRVGRAGEVAIAEHDEHRHGDAGETVVGEGAVAGRRR